jgi:hypothetical protein
MKKYSMLLILVLRAAIGYCQDPCEDYSTAFATVKIAQAQYNQAGIQKNRDALINASAVAAAKLAACLSVRTDLDKAEQLAITYQTGELYYDAGNCEKAQLYFGQCLAMPASATTMFKSYHFSYQQAIMDITHNDFCNATIAENMTGQKIIKIKRKFDYNGKGGMNFVDRSTGTDDLSTSNTVFSMPYFSYEIDSLRQRIFPIADSITAFNFFRSQTPGTPVVTFKSPFVLLNVNGEEMMVHGGQSNLQTSESGYNEPTSAVNAEITLLTHLLTNPLFKPFHSDSWIPIYCYNGEFSQDAYGKFQEFCKTLHFRYPGQRIGYRNEYDNSIVAWCASGNGTLAHEFSHVLLHADFPDIPEWLDEGMASLQEETYDDGEFADNWRLAYVKAYYAQTGRNLSLAEIVGDYQSDPLQNLVHDCYARYLCMFLIKKNKLNTLYLNLRDGGKSLSTTDEMNLILNGMDPSTFQSDFETYLGNRTPPGFWGEKAYLKTVKKNIAALDKQ